MHARVDLICRHSYGHGLLDHLLVAAAVKESSFFLVAFASLGGGMCSVARESYLIPVRWSCPYDLQQQQRQQKSSAARGEKAVASRLLRRLCAPPSVLLRHAQQLLHPLAALPTAQWIETNSALKRHGGSGGSKLSLSLSLSCFHLVMMRVCLFADLLQIFLCAEEVCPCK